MEHFTADVQSKDILPIQLEVVSLKSFNMSYELISVLFCMWV